MFDVNNILYNTDLRISYLESEDILYELSNKTDEEFICDLEKINIEKLEDAIIYLNYKKDLSDREKNIIERYNKYISNLIKDDIVSAVNNKYFMYLFNHSDIFDCDLLGVSIDDIRKKIHTTTNIIFDKFNNKQELLENEKDFCNNIILYNAFNRYIDSEDINDVNKYFTKYKINDLNSTKNKQLYLLSLIVKNISSMDGNVCIRFDDKKDTENEYITNGNFGRFEGKYIIIINDMDTYSIKTDKEFYRKIFTILHEIGHLSQEINYDSYSDKEKSRIDIEKDLINEDKNFYKNNHDKFFIENDADVFAIKKMMDEFGNIKEVCNICMQKLIRINKKLETDEDFFALEKETHDSIHGKII